MSGLIHIYYGDGKGKTTAAAGLAVRCAGAGKRVLFVQFLKNGSSSEINLLKEIRGLEICVVNDHHGFFKNMNETEREEATSDFSRLFDETVKKAQDGTELLVLDEIIAACNHNIVSESEVINFLNNKPKELEVVLTGRCPSEKLLATADYVTEMKKIKHPYDKGVNARLGVEY